MLMLRRVAACEVHERCKVSVQPDSDSFIRLIPSVNFISWKFNSNPNGTFNNFI